ncbi:alpha/beta hydrolase [Ruminococcus sp.]|uniref:alpha/beta fold hydrolase n=1 Tax=Ruminococcus sp. TaxID=41978 RepID=UPI0025E12964|nr:alpha/beta hydrolase [Ruminococcus sp.]MBQ8966518.1 alpha/beta hydrolase [Ruminococcus sp.]
MTAKEYGDKKSPAIMLLHGGGLAWWNYRDAAKALEDRCHVVIPALDGHADSDRPFTSIEDNAAELIKYIDENFGGKLCFIGGLSLGGQILLEMLSQRRNICGTAFIESAAVLPSKLTAAMLPPSIAASYGLIKKQWFAKAQFRSLRIKDDLYEDYYRDSCRISKADMTAFLTANQRYSLKDSISLTEAELYIIYGTREIPQIKRSAELIHKAVPHSKLLPMKDLYHGQFSINSGNDYAKEVCHALDKNQAQA